MPRQKKEEGAEPKRRSRTGCWPCKARKVKCGEEKPRCLNCERQGETCDYSIRLNWGGRSKGGAGFIDMSSSSNSSLPGIVFPSPEAFTGQPSPSPTRSTFSENTPPRRPGASHHSRSHSNLSLPPIGPGPYSDDRRHIERTSSNLSSDNIQHSSSGPNRSPRSPLIDPEMQSHQPEGSYMSFAKSRAGDMASGAPAIDPNGQFPSSMLPPYRVNPTSVPSAYGDGNFINTPNIDDSHRSKRARTFVPETEAQGSGMHQNAGMPTPLSSTLDIKSPNMPSVLIHQSPYQHTPLTPGSSVASDEQARHASHLAPIPNLPPPDIRRLSVSSLLVDNAGDGALRRSNSAEDQSLHIHTTSDCLTDYTIMYGYDRGEPDIDIPENNDAQAITPATPSLSRNSSANHMQICAGGHFVTEDKVASRARDMAFGPEGYYQAPVPIKISQSLGQLPHSLVENNMNLLYFHHFLNHTARILAPHDCEQNPYRSILPEMAIDDPDLMNLVLAYSASHRSRLLGHKPPINRIATYVSGVLPKLRHIVESSEPVSLNSLATAITLASLEILSPSDAISLPWRTHLEVVRQMMSARGGPLSAHRNDKFSYFLSRWFAYLDVLGSLSGGQNSRPPNQAYWSQEGDSEADNQIDCLLGFTRRCATILSRISDMIHDCEKLGRINMSTREIDPNWVPPGDIQYEAEQLINELHRGLAIKYRPCTHRTLSVNETEALSDAHEILATNEMYHWAAIIHLSTRVQNLPLSDSSVQRAVKKIEEGLFIVRQGSTAEACLLFPMFSAGASALSQRQRDRIMSRLKSVENFGMTQVTKARKLIERVWSEGTGWESLVTDEFLG